jgi:Cytochrome c, mono- and diheme variants
MKRYLLLISLFAVSVIRLSAQTWEVPEDKKARVSPFKFSTESVAKGQDIFKRNNCISCHGEPTKGNFQPMTPSPGDPATDKFQKQTDGALFYKITTGRLPMPSFKDVLSEEERWDVISYFRSFNKNYVQPDIELANQKGGPLALLTATFDSTANKLNVLVTDTLKRPMKGAKVFLYVKRYFGNLQLLDPLTSGEKGTVVFLLPKDIPGDRKGTIELIAKYSDESGNDIKKTLKLGIGVPNTKPPLTQNRAMWNISAKAPLWLLLSYTIVVGGIWGFLIYIIMQLFKLKKFSKENPS